MLGSKKIGIISALLTALALAFVVYMFINPAEKEGNIGTVTYENGQSIEFSDSDYDSDYTKTSYQKIQLGEEDVSITSSGVYELSGELSGSINVNSEGGGVVKLVLNGAHINSPNGAAINIQQADKTVIILAPGSENSVSDAAERDDIEISAAVYSKDDLVITGEGSLAVNANFADGIKSNDSLKVTGGDIAIAAADEGINVNDYIAFAGGRVNITSGGHGVKCANEEDSSLGFVVLDGTNINMECENDGIQATGDIYINSTESTLSVADDGIHSEKTLFLNGGKVDIVKCTEGFEGKYIIMNDGDYSVVSNDDGFNATGEGSMMGGFGGRGGANGEIYMTINGGRLHAEVGGDGLDSNGAARINGGFIEVYGPENGGNSTLDFDGGFEINGGTVLAAGSSGMAESPSESSAQNSVVVTLSQTYEAGTAYSLKDETGTEIAAGTSTKRFDWICISSPDIKTGSAYTLVVGETEEAALEVSSSVTSIGGKTWGGNFR